MTKLTFAQTIEEEADGPDNIIKIIVGRFRSFYHSDDGKRSFPSDLFGKVLDWEAARPHLDYKWDDSHGSEDCHPICAWTHKDVIIVSCYYGSTSVISIPRNPADTEPEFIGGG